jgi:hypothetical protein
MKEISQKEMNFPPCGKILPERTRLQNDFLSVLKSSITRFLKLWRFFLGSLGVAKEKRV